MGKALDTSGVWACGHWASHKYLCHLSGAQGFYAHRAPWTVPGRAGRECPPLPARSTHTLPWYPDGRLCQHSLRSGFPDPTSNF